MTQIERIRAKLSSVLSEYGITDEKTQMELIMKIINAFMER